MASGVQVEVGPGKFPTEEVTLEAFELLSERHLPVLYVIFIISL